MISVLLAVTLGVRAAESDAVTGLTERFLAG